MADVKFWIFGGMGRGFGGPSYLGDIDAKDEEEAIRESRYLVEEDYQSYEGLHGIPSWDDVQEELRSEMGDEEINEDTVEELYQQYISDNTSHWVAPAIEGLNPEDYLADYLYGENGIYND